jgi:integrase
MRVQYKADLICSHTARRSFATNAYKKGLPISSIMQITGHKTESSFRKYIQLSGKEHALELIKRNDLGGQGQSAVMRTA